MTAALRISFRIGKRMRLRIFHCSASSLGALGLKAAC